MKPIEVSQIELACGGDMRKLMPSAEILSHPPRGWGGNLFSKLFFDGGDVSHLRAKEGIDGAMALRHIRAIMGSYDPQHEHKAAACAYLFELWFEEPAAEGEAK